MSNLPTPRASEATAIDDADVVRLNAELAARNRTIEELRAVIEADRTKVAGHITALDKVLHARFWLTEGRGSYEWDDDRYKEEFRAAVLEVLEVLKPLRQFGADLTNCPQTTDAVLAARADKDKQIEGLRKESDRYKETSENYLTAIHRFDMDIERLETANAELRARLTAAGEVERRLRVALVKLWKHTQKIDNGRCMVCRRGYRYADTKGNVGPPCSDSDCLSHVIEAARALAPSEAAKNVEELVVAATPFAQWAGQMDASPNWLPDACPLVASPSSRSDINVGRLRALRAAIAKLGGGK